MSKLLSFNRQRLKELEGFWVIYSENIYKWKQNLSKKENVFSDTAKPVLAHGNLLMPHPEGGKGLSVLGCTSF